ncbi:MAG TPA: TadE/TadG family type IV pilus assembly protein [Xanthobacteraceae bacterium]|nr:TadE/TadG family type IV pilus assembly protein [Xanthobacteraceae bacterium]
MIQAIRARLLCRTKELLRARLLRVTTVRRFAQGEDAMTTVEFGLIALPFFALVFAILETAMIFFAGQTLETAVADSARLILTGQAQSQGFTQSEFQNAVCARIYGLINCQGGLQIDVRTFSSFSSITTTPPIDSNGNLQTSTFGYSPGTACEIVLVRLMYAWPVYFTMLGLGNVADLSGNQHLIMATAAFRNEPFGSGSC